jgi:hypothetical protein
MTGRTTPDAFVRAALAVALTMTLAGCGASRPKSAHGTSRPTVVPSESCGPALARAHGALAAAAGDSAPAAHLALASHAAAMHEYHSCLASGGTP